MRVINVDNREGSPKTFGSIKIAPKPLKKQKSLTTLFTPRLRPSPPPEPIPRPKTATPPSKPSAGSLIPSSPLSLLPKTSQNNQFATHGTARPTDAFAPVEKEGQYVQELQNLRSGSPTKWVDSRSRIRRSSTGSDATIESPQIASTSPNSEAGEPMLKRSPTFPLPVQSSSVADSSPPSHPRRGSVSNVVEPSPIKITIPFRPSTATSNNRWNKQNHGIFRIEAEIGPFSEDKWRHPGIDHPWDYKFDDDQVRASVRSALTSNSSFHDASSTERSSVATRNTTIGGLMQDALTPTGRHASMTVDDAIDMYAAGFGDDEDDCLENTSVRLPLNEEHRRSVKIAEAIDEPIGLDLRPSSTIVSENLRNDLPTSMQPQPAMRDQYGFLKASHSIKDDQYDIWNFTYTPSQGRRIQKWLSYMRELSLPTHVPVQFPPRSVKTQRFIRKGIPPRWRGDAWFFYAGGDELLHKHPDQYSTLVSRSESELSSNDKDTIERDLHRTFPDNIHFKPESTVSSVQLPSIETPLLSSLRRVLQAFALYCPRIGYCQSLNFIAGLLLLFLPEEKSFWMLHIITTDYLPGTHDVSLEGANVDLWVLMIAFKESMPALWPKISNVDGKTSSGDPKLPTISLCTTSWFMSLFIGTLPIESVLRVWDILFYEGSRTLFRVALAIFKLGEPRIKAMSDPMEIFQIVQALPRGMLDIGALLDVAFRRGGISQDWVEKRRKQRKKWYARARAHASATAATTSSSSSLAAGDESLSSGALGSLGSGSGFGKSASVWRRAGQRMGGA